MSTQLIISEILWDEICQLLKEEKREVEQVLFIEGLIFGSRRIATSIIIPDAHLSRGNYQISSDSILECSELIKGFNLKRVAQVHTHPGSNVSHSNYDDRNAYSFVDGSISIVIPNYGSQNFDLSDCGVHEYMSGAWLRHNSATPTIQIVPSIKDYRKCKPKSRQDIEKKYPASLTGALKRILNKLL